jgi:hypothetical protein
VSSPTRQSFKAAEPVSSSDPHPTPFAQAIVPEAVPPDSVESVKAIDARVDRLLAEQLSLLVERKQLREIADERANRSTELLTEARAAKKLVRSYIEARHAVRKANKHITAGIIAGEGHSEDLDGLSEAADRAFEALEAWAAKTL